MGEGGTESTDSSHHEAWWHVGTVQGVGGVYSVLRNGEGWFVIDFGDGPSRPSVYPAVDSLLRGRMTDRLSRRGRRGVGRNWLGLRYIYAYGKETREEISGFGRRVSDWAVG